MDQKSSVAVDFLLGTTTPAGFRGYFEQLAHEPNLQLYLIKSGPGCGKSTLMKRLAEMEQAAGGPVERIHCSSDPDSLDGVVFGRRSAAIVDATAPHTLEPEAPGADEIVVSLYHTIDAAALHEDQSEVKALFERNHSLRGRASRYIASAGGLVLDSRRTAACSTDFDKVRRYAKRLCARLLPRTGGTGYEKLRLLTAITPQGALFYRNTVAALAKRAVVFRDEYGAASRLLLEVIREEALVRGYTIFTCPCALHPDEKIDHILIPALGLAFLTDNSWHPVQLGGMGVQVQTVRCARFMDTANLAAYRARLRFNRRAAAELIEQAVALMAQAKSCHDELENYYRAAVDFDAVEAATQDCARDMGLLPSQST